MSFSQDTTFIVFPKESALKKGNYALVFELGTMFGYPGFFEAFTLTAKKHLADNLAIRLSFGGNMFLKNGDEKSYDESGNIVSASAQNYDYTIETSINLQYYIVINHKIKPFVTFGPYTTYSFNGSSHYNYSNITEQWGVGIFSSFGLEMFIMDNISLIGEYVLKATYGKSLYKNRNNNNNKENYTYFNEFRIKLNTARLGFSVYF
jgi:hypothetical protein